MKIVNLTPHSLTLVGTNGTLVVPQSDQVARLDVTRRPLDPITVDGIELPVNVPAMGDVTGLPDPQDGVLYVVSALVADAAKRPDVYSPGNLIRDANGVIIGAQGLCAYAGEVQQPDLAARVAELEATIVQMRNLHETAVAEAERHAAGQEYAERCNLTLLGIISGETYPAAIAEFRTAMAYHNAYHQHYANLRKPTPLKP